MTDNFLMDAIDEITLYPTFAFNVIIKLNSIGIDWIIDRNELRIFFRENQLPYLIDMTTGVVSKVENEYE